MFMQLGLFVSSTVDASEVKSHPRKLSFLYMLILGLAGTLKDVAAINTTHSQR